jgi:hypothetical protein
MVGPSMRSRPSSPPLPPVTTVILFIENFV